MKKKVEIKFKDRDIEVLNYLRAYPDEVIAKFRTCLFQNRGYDKLRDSIRKCKGILSIYLEVNGSEWKFCFWNGEADLNRMVKWLI